MEKKTTNWAFFKKTYGGGELEVVGNRLTLGLVAALLEVSLFLIFRCFGYRITDPAFVAMLLGAGILVLTGRLIPKKKYLDGGLKFLSEVCQKYIQEGYTPFYGSYSNICEMEETAVTRDSGNLLPQLILNDRLSGSSLSDATLYFHKEKDGWTYILKLEAEEDCIHNDVGGVLITNILYGRWNGTEEMKALLNAELTNGDEYPVWLADIRDMVFDTSAEEDIEGVFFEEYKCLYSLFISEYDYVSTCASFSFAVIPSLSLCSLCSDFRSGIADFFERLFKLKACNNLTWKNEISPRFPTLLYGELAGAFPEKYAGNFSPAGIIGTFWFFLRVASDDMVLWYFMNSTAGIVTDLTELSEASICFKEVLSEFVISAYAQ